MSLFRSDKMGFFSLIASREYAWEILNELGQHSAVQFLDMNGQEPSFNRPYSNYVRRCEDMESKLNTIKDHMDKFNVKIHPCEEPQDFLRNLKYSLSNRNRAERTYLDDVEAEIDDRMAALGEQIRAYENFVENYNHLVEFREVLLKTRPYIGGAGVELPGGSGFRDIRFNYLAGVINKEDSLRFRRILFRITRGMTFTALVDIEGARDAYLSANGSYFIESSKERKQKTVFVVVYQGGEHEMLKGKLNRICDSFGASKYGIPEDQNGFNKKLYEVENQLGDAKNVIQVTKGHVETVLRHFSEPSSDLHSYSHYEGLRLFVIKEKTLYHNLNMLRPQQALVRGNCWCPLDRVDDVQATLSELNRKKGEMGGCEFRKAAVPGGISPPTHFRTNEFTYPFQEIVNTYGIPRYREINPGLFAIATFPFLFGIMFGDIGHGALLFIAGLYLVFWKESIEKDKDSIWNAAIGFRYLIAMQGFFAFFCGLIYNDFMSLPLNLFGSCYGDISEGRGPKTCNYPFGVDPGWYGVSNELTFLNSFKMKLAIVLGVSQMTFGILLRGLNSIFARKWLDFFFEFIPMLVLMSVTFGYMVVLIFIKWALPWGTAGYPISDAPSIIAIFIKMALSPGKWDPTVGIPLYGDAEGNLQASIQLVFLLLAMLCSVLILVPKPLILWITHKPVRAQQDLTLQHTDYNMTQNLLETSPVEDNQLLIAPNPERQEDLVRKVEQGHPQHPGDHFDMGEVFVHQVIETIEFVLGTISNTASYLRLWALSLAHSQLAKVFLFNTLGSSIQGGSIFMAFITFWIFANITLGVLMLMDQMECFLHALRLHWVEFQNKFYKADGYSFGAFSFEKALKDSNIKY